MRVGQTHAILRTFQRGRKDAITLEGHPVILVENLAGDSIHAQMSPACAVLAVNGDIPRQADCAVGLVHRKDQLNRNVTPADAPITQLHRLSWPIDIGDDGQRLRDGKSQMVRSIRDRLHWRNRGLERIGDPR